MIVIVDYGMGNLGSIKNMLRKIGANSVISSEVKEIEKAEKIILPGVGAFDNGIKNLAERNLTDILYQRAIEDKIPVLGICLGMQLLLEKSAEGILGGLGWIKGKVEKFDFSGAPSTGNNNLKVPHMGWNTIDILKPNRLTNNFPEEPRFYFVHSYYAKCSDPDNVFLQTTYGSSFASGIFSDNIFGVQFHPEKSHKFGLELFKNFLLL